MSSARRTTHRSAAAMAALISLAACGGDGAGPPESGPPPTPATMAPASSTTLAAAVATSVPVAVRVLDGGGVGVANVPVTFSVVRGGGSVQPTAGRTNVDGEASASWQLGSVAGTNELRAASTGLPALSFHATGSPGPIARLLKVSGDGQQGFQDSPLPDPLRVRATDAHDNPLPALSVTFEVTAGGGVIGGSPAVTDQQGLASGGPWTLGTGGTAQTVTAASGGVTVIFGATLDPCPLTPLAPGVPLQEALTGADCQVEGRAADRYRLGNPEGHALQLTLASTSFTPRLEVRAAGFPVAHSGANANMAFCVFSGDGCHTPYIPPSGAAITLLTTPGTLIVTASAAEAQGAGPYTVSAEISAAEISNCEAPFLQRGMTTTQALSSTDCGVVYGERVLYFTDDFRVYAVAGTSLELVMSSTSFTPWVDVFSPNGLFLTACVAPGVAACTLTIPVTGYYLLAASSFEERATGTYNFTVR